VSLADDAGTGDGDAKGGHARILDWEPDGGRNGDAPEWRCSGLAPHRPHRSSRDAGCGHREY
ncbi:hypothetical protein, partial [Stenotrophomonas maltophilia]|uniref:hypothetical protein n=1 Tax=Stenotrophomonas maltophilia TaxID=40324 RepID=UPI002552D267